MKRLTKTYKDGSFGVADDLPCGENSYAFKELLINNLGVYENMEAHGKIIKLPCAVGDIIYKIFRKDNKIYHYLIKCIGCYLDDIGLRFQFYVQSGIATIVFYEDDIGETVFLTYEEAEKKIKELNKND